jgi:S1-C subfamily serine protease
VYLGQAAHCSSTGSNTETNGCSTKSLPLGTAIYAGDLVNGGIQNGTLIGTLAYNSWIAMQKAGEKDAATCAYNDLALIKISAAHAANVNPTVPFWGGPNGLAAGAAPLGERVFTYGNSILRGGVSALSPKTGLSLGEGEESAGWSSQVYTVTPGIPGDSGSAYMNGSGDALGILSTVELAPVPASNGVGTLAKELAYANSATGLGVKVAQGTTAFSSTPVPPAP